MLCIKNGKADRAELNLEYKTNIGNQGNTKWDAGGHLWQDLAYNVLLVQEICSKFLLEGAAKAEEFLKNPENMLKEVSFL